MQTDEVYVNGSRYVPESRFEAAIERIVDLRRAIEHVITDSVGTPDSVKKYLHRAVKGERF